MADGGEPIREVEGETKLEVRCATPDEVDEVMRLAIAGCEENAFVPYEADLVLQDVWAALNLHQGVVGVIGPVGGRLEGAVLLRVGTIWYSRSPTIEERAIYVDPDFRSAKGGRAARLFEFSHYMADSLGLPLTIGVLSDARVTAKIRLYTREMGPPDGGYWIYWPVGHPKHRDPKEQPTLPTEKKAAIKALYAEAKKIGREAGLEHPEDYVRQLFTGVL